MSNQRPVQKYVEKAKPADALGILVALALWEDQNYRVDPGDQLRELAKARRVNLANLRLQATKERRVQLEARKAGKGKKAKKVAKKTGRKK